MRHFETIRGLRGRRDALCIPLAGMVWLLMLHATTAAPGSEAPSAAAPLQALERVFREAEPGRIRQLADKGEKILIDSETLGFPRGYYSVDQVCLVMGSLFRSRSTITFNFLSGGTVPQKGPRIVAVGRWTFRTGRSRETSAQIAFTLLHRNDGWTLKEVRDVP